MTAATPSLAARQILLSSRPLSWINTAFPFAAAYYLTTRQIDAPLIVGTVFFLIPYNLAMYGINDVFDYESDIANPRKGGVQGAVMGRELHRATLASSVVVVVPFLAFLCAVGDPASWIVLAISMFAVVAYSVTGLRFKERPILDSATSSTHFVSPAVYGLVLAGASFTPPLIALLCAFFLWGMASQAFGAVQDIIPDRAGGIRSVATVMGAARTTRIAIIVWFAAGLLMLVTAWPGPLGSLLVLPYIGVAARYWSVSDRASPTVTGGWELFLGLNYLCGFLATLLLILYARTP